MRLRKNMKRAAAAALALSVALSAAAPTALAKDYYINNGDITVTVTEKGRNLCPCRRCEKTKMTSAK